jgi:hypothetical protein
VTFLGEREQKFQLVDQKEASRFPEQRISSQRISRSHWTRMQKAAPNDAAAAIIVFSYRMISYPY